MIAHDPLSLVFLACFLVSGGFLVVSTLLGGHHDTGHVHFGGHDLHVGGHDLHIGGHLHVDQGAHLGNGAHVAGHGLDAGHGAHLGNGAHAATSGASTSVPAPAPWQTFSQTLMSGLNLYSILMFLLVFGLVGYLLHNLTHVGVVLSLVLPALLGGLAGLALGNLMFRLFLPGAESELSADSSRLEGRLGQVSMAIREGGIGEVLFTRAGVGRQSVGARSADGQPIAAGAEVVILGYRDGIATVQPWDRFMIDVRSGREPLLEPLDPQP